MIKRKKDGKNQQEVKDRCNRMWKKWTVKKQKPIAYHKADKKKGKYKETFHTNKKTGKKGPKPKTHRALIL